MARLTAEQWEQARAEYEVRGISLREVAKVIGVDRAAVSKRAKKEGWTQGKSHMLVERKVAAIKEIMNVEAESHTLPATFQHTIETVAKERLQAEGLLASFDIALITKGIDLLNLVETPADYELIARSRKHLAPQAPKESTTVNVSQRQTAIQQLTPRDALIEITRQAAEYPIFEDYAEKPANS